jgi:uncharacterized protein YjbJ (UPF0337 family)
MPSMGSLVHSKQQKSLLERVQCIHLRIRTFTVNVGQPAILQRTEIPMADNRTEGTKHQVKGSIKEGVSKVTGNKSGELEGKAEKNLGKGQKEFGKQTDS